MMAVLGSFAKTNSSWIQLIPCQHREKNQSTFCHLSPIHQFGVPSLVANSPIFISQAVLPFRARTASIGSMEVISIRATTAITGASAARWGSPSDF
jgi:hypothetical protein